MKLFAALNTGILKARKNPDESVQRTTFGTYCTMSSLMELQRVAEVTVNIGVILNTNLCMSCFTSFLKTGIYREIIEDQLRKYKRTAFYTLLKIYMFTLYLFDYHAHS